MIKRSELKRFLQLTAGLLGHLRIRISYDVDDTDIYIWINSMGGELPPELIAGCDMAARGWVRIVLKIDHKG